LDLTDKVTNALNLIRPALQSDDGDLELVDIRDNKVIVKLTGTCQGCPSATTHLQRAILTALKSEAPEIDELIYLQPDGKEKTTKPLDDDPYGGQKRIEGIKLVIAVASGKGGVGKSTVAVNLALALKSKGLKIGILDADIYGPNTPTMLGVDKAPISKYKKIEPAHPYGIKLMSIGFYVKQEAAMIWRGPMVMKAIDQFLRDVEWGDLDVLIVDLPPGTGDAQLTLLQRVPVDGAIIVTTPSDVALIDARRGLEMFKKGDVLVLGIIENMSYFLCPHCGERTNIFSAGGGKETTNKIRTQFLGEIPLDPYIRRTGDHGKPFIVDDEHSPQAVRFMKITNTIWNEITTRIPGWDKSGCHFFSPAKSMTEIRS